STLSALRVKPDGLLAPRISEILSERYGVPAKAILEMAAAEAARVAAGNVATPRIEPLAGDLLTEEWEAFLTPHGETDDRNRFITRSVPVIEEGSDEGALAEAVKALDPLIRRVVL